MRRIAPSARFVWEFVVGDDWRIAPGVALGLGITALIADTSVAAWWILPLVVLLLLSLSVVLAVRRT